MYLTGEQVFEGYAVEKFSKHFLRISEDKRAAEVRIKVVPVASFGSRHLEAFLAILIVNASLLV